MKKLVEKSSPQKTRTISHFIEHTRAVPRLQVSYHDFEVSLNRARAGKERKEWRRHTRKILTPKENN